MAVRASRPSTWFATEARMLSPRRPPSFTAPPVLTHLFPREAKGGCSLSIDLEVWRQLGLSTTLGPKWEKHMEKEFQPKNLAGPGVGSSVDTAPCHFSCIPCLTRRKLFSAETFLSPEGEAPKPRSWAERPKVSEAMRKSL